MRRRRNRRAADAPEKNHERWLITYSDLITLLLIFFVVLYAMSQLDLKKYEVLAQSLQHQFNKSDAVLDGGRGMTGRAVEGGSSLSSPVPQKTLSSPNRSKESEKDQLQRLQEKELQDLLKIIQTYIKENRLQNQVYVADMPKGISIRLNDLFLFDPDRAELKKGAVPVLNKLSSLFRSLDNTVSIEGHTDNLPVSAGGQYGDNWELSAGRALSVLHYFIKSSKLPPTKFEIAGYADTRPISSNETQEGRSRNRRVEITVLRRSMDTARK